MIKIQNQIDILITKSGKIIIFEDFKIFVYDLFKKLYF